MTPYQFTLGIVWPFSLALGWHGEMVGAFFALLTSMIMTEEIDWIP